VKKEDLKASFDQIKLSESAKKRMLDNIMNHSNKKKGICMTLYSFKKAVPALALTLVIAVGLLTYNMLTGNNNSQPEYGVTDSIDQGREDAVAPILNQFKIGDKNYILLSDDLRADYGLPTAVNENDIGEKIADIKSSPDKNLIGSEVYSYIPAGGEAVVAVKKDNKYQLFRFFVFDSYNNNQDEDSVRYMELYGIKKADDIAKIQFIGHSEQGKLQGITDIRGEIADRNEIARFYSYYSILKNSSDKYFDRLFNYKVMDSGNNYVETDTAVPDQISNTEDRSTDAESSRTNVAEDLPQVTDNGDTGSETVESSQGSAGKALENPITIRIYNQSGVYYDSEYYPNIGFISRFEVSEDFADFINKYSSK